MSDTKYVIEMGIDAFAAPGPEGNYPFILSVAEVEEWDSPTGASTWLTGLQRPAHFVVRICDYSRTTPSGLEPQSLFATFLDPSRRNVLVPLVPINPICRGHFDISPAQELSVVVSGAPGWKFVDSQAPNSEKIFQFQPSTTATRALLLLHAYANIPLGDEQLELRRYCHDPEIIVGPGT